MQNLPYRRIEISINCWSSLLVSYLYIERLTFSLWLYRSTTAIRLSSWMHWARSAFVLYHFVLTFFTFFPVILTILIMKEISDPNYEGLLWCIGTYIDHLTSNKKREKVYDKSKLEFFPRLNLYLMNRDKLTVLTYENLRV